MLISYAHDWEQPGHAGQVRSLWTFLRSCGIDARLDLPAAGRRQDWSLWMADEIRAADVILVIASPAYRQRAEGRGDPGYGQGVQWEARLIRDAFYRDQRAVDRFVPVILPGQNIHGVPDFLAPHTSSVYRVQDFTVRGAEGLLRLLTGQPDTLEPPLGGIPTLPPLPDPSMSAEAGPKDSNPPMIGVGIGLGRVRLSKLRKTKLTKALVATAAIVCVGAGAAAAPALYRAISGACSARTPLTLQMPDRSGEVFDAVVHANCAMDRSRYYRLVEELPDVDSRNPHPAWYVKQSVDYLPVNRSVRLTVQLKESANTVGKFFVISVDQTGEDLLGQNHVIDDGLLELPPNRIESNSVEHVRI